MLIAHITDLHIGFEPGNPDEPNIVRLRTIVAALLALNPAPDALLITGDLTENGDAASYESLKSVLTPLAMRRFLTVGNHDVRDVMAAAFPDTPIEDGFIQYVVDLGDRRLIVLDTRDEERQGGAFCERRAAWLRTRLAEAPAVPTLIALHHPVLPVGIDWMDPADDAPWIERLREIVAAAPQVVAVVGGHLHRPMAARWANTLYIGASSVAPQLALDFRSTDIAPDGRTLIVAEPPAYILHRWGDAGLISHFATAGDYPPILRFDAAISPVIAALRHDSAG